MSQAVLIVIGILLLLVLILFVVARVPSLKAGINSMNKWVALLIFVLLVGALAYVVLKAFFPGGPESVLSQVEQGSEEGEAQEDLNIGEEEKETGTGFGYSEAVKGNNEGDQTVYITISQDVVKIGDVPFGDAETFRAALVNVAAEAGEFCLVDDYAFASVWHTVEEILKEEGIRYTVQEKE